MLASGEALADRAAEMKAREAFAAGRYEDALGLLAKLYAEVYRHSLGTRHGLTAVFSPGGNALVVGERGNGRGPPPLHRIVSGSRSKT